MNEKIYMIDPANFQEQKKNHPKSMSGDTFIMRKLAESGWKIKQSNGMGGIFTGPKHPFGEGVPVSFWYQ